MKPSVEIAKILLERQVEKIRAAKTKESKLELTSEQRAALGDCLRALLKEVERQIAERDQESAADQGLIDQPPSVNTDINQSRGS